jgi:hypothetical protein
VDLDFGVDFEGFEGEGNHLPGGVTAVRWDSYVIGSNGDSGGCGGMGGDGNYVVDFESLIDGGEAVEAVRTGGADVEAEVDFGVRTDGCGHTNFIVERMK